MPQVPGTSLNSIPATTFDDSGMIPSQGSWWDAFTKPYINPQTGQPELLGAPDTSAEAARNTPWWLGKGGFWPTLLYSTLYPTSTASNDTLPAPASQVPTTNLPNLPYGPAAQRSPQSPLSTTFPTGLPQIPRTAAVDSPLSTTFPTGLPQHDVPKPSVKPASPRGNGKTKLAPAVAAPAPPGMYALGGQTQAIGSGRSPLAYDPYYQGFRS